MFPAGTVRPIFMSWRTVTGPLKSSDARSSRLCTKEVAAGARPGVPVDGGWVPLGAGVPVGSACIPSGDPVAGDAVVGGEVSAVFGADMTDVAGEPAKASSSKVRCCPAKTISAPPPTGTRPVTGSPFTVIGVLSDRHSMKN